MWNSPKVIWRPCRATEYCHKIWGSVSSPFSYLQVLSPRYSCNGKESHCRCWQGKAQSLLFKPILYDARVKGVYLLAYSIPNPDVKSSPSCHNHDSYEEGCRQWLEMQAVLQFLCWLPGKNFSGPKKEFFRCLGKRSDLTRSKFFWKFFCCSEGCSMEQAGIFISSTAPGP